MTRETMEKAIDAEVEWCEKDLKATANHHKVEVDIERERKLGFIEGLKQAKSLLSTLMRAEEHRKLTGG